MALTICYNSLIQRLSNKGIDALKWTARDIEQYVNDYNETTDNKLTISVDIYAAINQALYSNTQLDNNIYISCKNALKSISKLKYKMSNYSKKRC